MSKLSIRDAGRAVIALRRRCTDSGMTLCLAAGSLPEGGRFTRGTHVHDSWELKFAAAGVMNVRFPGLTLCLKAPSCCMIAPATPHETSHVCDVSKSSRGFVMCRDGGRFEFGPVALEGARRRAELDHVRMDGLAKELGEPVDSYLERLASGLTPYGRPTRSSGVIAGLAGFLDALANAIPDEDPQECESPAEVVARAEAFLRSRYYDPELTVEDAALAVGRTPTHLAAMFSRLRHRTVRASLVAIRLEKAREFLASGRYSVKEVSYLTGWGSPYYFSNSFAHHHGCRPSAVSGLQAVHNLLAEM